MTQPFQLSKAKHLKGFVLGFLSNSTIRINQKVVVIDGQTWQLQFDPLLVDAFTNKGFVSVMCIISCQTYRNNDRNSYIAVAKPHFYSSYNTALHHSYNGRAKI